jgi:hypothetical protein
MGRDAVAARPEVHHRLFPENLIRAARVGLAVDRPTCARSLR